MKMVRLLAVTVFGCIQPVFAIYGPQLARADRAVALAACREAGFAEAGRVAEAMVSGNSIAALHVLGGALKEFRETAETSGRYPARAFCVHELVPGNLAANPVPYTDRATRAAPTAEVKAFKDLGIEYAYYEPDGQWGLRESPVDLNELAEKHLDSRWGREAFLMMTRLGWSQGACKEGPDQFRTVIEHGKAFLASYPHSEVSGEVRLQMANAYATWWNLSKDEPRPGYSFNPANYEKGAAEAREAAIDLYRVYLASRKVPDQQVRQRLKEFEENPKGLKTYDYYCEEYAD